jgi:hypothetical protein
MATVINLNILNFFKLKLNKFTVNNIHLTSYQRERKPPQKDIIIDVTPYSSIVDDSEKEIVLPATTSSREVKSITRPSIVNKTYDRKGNTVHYFYSKGMHIDSYV